ncbi:MAG: antibiotic biosynthesis monooxygenase [Dehalococcoidia bacterium]
MFARVDMHWVNEGMKDRAAAQISENTASAKKTGDVLLRYQLWSESDPSKVITMSIWKSKEAWEKWREISQAERGQMPSDSNPFAPPSPWVKIEGDNYEPIKEV